MIIKVIRSTPPEIGRCNYEPCSAAIEWVRTLATNRAMPITAPLEALGVTTLIDGVVVTEIDTKQSHFVTCPAAERFRKPRK